MAGAIVRGIGVGHVNTGMQHAGECDAGRRGQVRMGEETRSGKRVAARVSSRLISAGTLLHMLPDGTPSQNPRQGTMMAIVFFTGGNEVKCAGQLGLASRVAEEQLGRDEELLLDWVGGASGRW